MDLFQSSLGHGLMAYTGAPGPGNNWSEERATLLVPVQTGLVLFLSRLIRRFCPKKIIFIFILEQTKKELRLQNLPKIMPK